jgi:hypothetical protein
MLLDGFVSRGAKATCSVHESRFDRLNAAPSDWSHSRLLADFHALRQDFAKHPVGQPAEAGNPNSF